MYLTSSICLVVLLICQVQFTEQYFNKQQPTSFKPVQQRTYTRQWKSAGPRTSTEVNNDGWLGSPLRTLSRLSPVRSLSNISPVISFMRRSLSSWLSSPQKSDPNFDTPQTKDNRFKPEEPSKKNVARDVSIKMGLDANEARNEPEELQRKGPSNPNFDYKCENGTCVLVPKKKTEDNPSEPESKGPSNPNFDYKCENGTCLLVPKKKTQDNPSEPESKANDGKPHECKPVVINPNMPYNRRSLNNNGAINKPSTNVNDGKPHECKPVVINPKDRRSQSNNFNGAGIKPSSLETNGPQAEQPMKDYSDEVVERLMNNYGAPLDMKSHSSFGRGDSNPNSGLSRKPGLDSQRFQQLQTGQPTINFGSDESARQMIEGLRKNPSGSFATKPQSFQFGDSKPSAAPASTWLDTQQQFKKPQSFQFGDSKQSAAPASTWLDTQQQFKQPQKMGSLRSGYSEQKPNQGPMSMKSQGVQEIKSSGELKLKLNEAGNRLVVMDLYSTTCVPCKQLAPILSDLANKHTDVVFLKVNIDSGSCFNIVIDYNPTGLPVLVYLQKSKEIQRTNGMSPTVVSKLKQLVQSYSQVK